MHRTGGLGARGRAWRQVREHSHHADPSWGPATSTPPLPAPPTQPWGVPQTAAQGDGDEDEDEDDGDFVEVPEKEGYEACVPEHLWPEDGEYGGRHGPRVGSGPTDGELSEVGPPGGSLARGKRGMGSAEVPPARPLLLRRSHGGHGLVSGRGFISLILRLSGRHLFLTFTF